MSACKLDLKTCSGAAKVTRRRGWVPYRAIEGILFLSFFRMRQGREGAMIVPERITELIIAPGNTLLLFVVFFSETLHSFID